MPDQIGEIDHQLATDLTDHALYLGVIAFAALVGLLLTLLVLEDSRRRRKARRDRAVDEAEAQRRRQRGIDEGFRKGYHG